MQRYFSPGNSVYFLCPFSQRSYPLLRCLYKGDLAQSIDVSSVGQDEEPDEVVVEVVLVDVVVVEVEVDVVVVEVEVDVVVVEVVVVEVVVESVTVVVPVSVVVVVVSVVVLLVPAVLVVVVVSAVVVVVDALVVVSPTGMSISSPHLAYMHSKKPGSNPSKAESGVCSPCSGNPAVQPSMYGSRGPALS